MNRKQYVELIWWMQLFLEVPKIYFAIYAIITNTPYPTFPLAPGEPYLSKSKPEWILAHLLFGLSMSLFVGNAVRDYKVTRWPKFDGYVFAGLHIAFTVFTVLNCMNFGPLTGTKWAPIIVIGTLMALTLEWLAVFVHQHFYKFLPDWSISMAYLDYFVILNLGTVYTAIKTLVIPFLTWMGFIATHSFMYNPNINNIYQTGSNTLSMPNITFLN